jgi:hypothetical protein
MSSIGSSSDSTIETMCLSSSSSSSCSCSSDSGSRISKLVALRYDLRREIEYARPRLEDLIRSEHRIDTEILRTCRHVWVLDEQQDVGPYDRRDSVCSVCTSRNIAPGR